MARTAQHIHLDRRADAQQVEARLRRLAWLLDNSIPVPGIGYRIGLDGLIGLVPGVGDTVGAVLSTYILAQASALGVPKVTILRMAYNVAVESIVGMVPILGDLFDFAWKANQRNVELLEKNLKEPTATVRSDRWFVIGVSVALLAFIAFLVWLGFMVLGWVLGLIF